MPSPIAASPTRRLLSDFGAEYEAQEDLMNIFLSFCDKNFQGERLHCNFVEEIPWLLSIHRDMQFNLGFYRSVRGYIMKRRVSVPPTTQSVPSVANKIICAIWQGGNRAAALRVLSAIKTKQHIPRRTKSLFTTSLLIT